MFVFKEYLPSKHPHISDSRVSDYKSSLLIRYTEVT